jgi:hypothetical protein
MEFFNDIDPEEVIQIFNEFFGYITNSITIDGKKYDKNK